jgi:hypothetical protein
MGTRKTGRFNAPEEIGVLTCDIRERDVGHSDGRRPLPHLRLTRHPSDGAFGAQKPAVVLCSKQCLSAYADSITDLDRYARTSAEGA